MEKKNIIKESVILILLFVPILIMLLLWNRLPENLPVHWNIKGDADNYAAKYVFALLNAGLYLLFLIIPKIDPRKKNYTIFSTTYYKFRLIFTLFFSLLFLLVMYNAVYARIDFEKIFPVSFLFLFALLGNYMGTIKSNYFIGIRTPWTLNNDKVWRETHMFAGRIMFFGGIIGGLISFFISNPYSQYFAISVIIIMLLVPIVYSYVYYRKLEASAQL